MKKHDPRQIQNIFNSLMDHDPRPASQRSVGQKPGKGKRITITGATVTDVNEVDPTDGGTLVSEPFPLFANMTMDDINQGNLADCWFLAALASIVMFPEGQALLKTICRIDPSDSTKAIVTYTRNGLVTNIHCDLLVSVEFNQFDPVNQDLWVELFEKTYAFFRNGMDTYASLNYGNASGIYNDLGLVVGNLSIIMPNLWDQIRTNLANQVSTCIPTVTSGATIPGLVLNHEYTVTAIDINNVVTMRNPWGGPNPYIQVQPADLNTVNFSWGIEYANLPAIVVPPPVPVTYTQAQYDANYTKGQSDEKAKIKGLLVKVNADLV